MRQRFVISSAAALMIGAFCYLQSAQAQQPVAMKIAAPELKEIDEWINTKPFQLKELRGKVVALHFWTFG